MVDAIMKEAQRQKYMCANRTVWEIQLVFL